MGEPGFHLKEFDWSPDGELAKRFKVWKEQVDLFCWKRITFVKNKDGDTADNQQQYCCRTIMGLAGEIGLQYIESAKKSTTDPKIDGTKWEYKEYLAVLEKETEVGESGMKPAQDYKLLAQGKMNALQFHKKCTDVVLKMGIKEKDAIEIMVRNAFVLGISSHVAYDKIMALKHVERTSTRSLELTRDAEEAAMQKAAVSKGIATSAELTAAHGDASVKVNLLTKTRSGHGGKKSNRDAGASTSKTVHCFKCGHDDVIHWVIKQISRGNSDANVPVQADLWEPSVDSTHEHVECVRKPECEKSTDPAF